MRHSDDRSNAARVLGQHSAKRRFSGMTATEKSEHMRKVRMAKINKIAAQLKKERPKGSDSWAIANAVFLNQNRENKE
jgi:hypothetical protein